MLHSARLFRISLIYSGIALLVVATGTTPVLAADSTPPATDLILSGVEGNQDWYVTSVDVNLRAFDLESSPASTTYQINSDSPITKNFESLDNAIINPSFESGWLIGINNWQPVAPGGWSLLYQSSTARLGYRSAAIASFSGEYQYWTNHDNYIPVVAGKTYSVSTWIKTFNITTAPGAWFEVWALDSTGAKSDSKRAESDKVAYELDWTLKAVEFTIPAGYDGVYVKLGSQSAAGLTWYDGVSMYTGADALTQFTMLQNGQNTLRYYSTDNQGNSEPTNIEFPIKIDTVQPQDWSDFGWQQQGNNHTYASWVSVRDVSSGVQVSSAQYRWYDSGGCNCWSGWLPMDSVTRIDTGASAASGYTGYVKLQTPPTDMGNSAINTKPKVQFRLYDVASSLATSPAYSLFGPWLKVVNGGDIFANGGIDSLGPLPDGEYTTHGVIIGGDSLYNVASYYSWLVAPYTHALPTGPTLSDFLPHYNQIRSRAVALPGNKLPSTSGVYYYTGNYTLDQNSLSSGFTSSEFSAIIIIEGNLSINRDYSLNDGSAVAFLVTGNIIFSENTSQSQGFLIAAGDINTNGSSEDSKKTASLTHQGGLIAGQNLIFGRDLGKNKNDNPAEIIDYPVKYLTNPVFAGLFGQQDARFKWQEIE